ncbi:MAG: dienelactone hydrolase family protein [Gemmatimonadales bacterium]
MANVTLNVSDGSTAPAWVTHPAGDARHPGLILFQEAFGVNAHIRDLAGRFAGEGYVVAAPEMFHRTADPGFEAAYTDFESVRPHVEKLTADGIAADAAAAYAFLQRDRRVDPDRIAAIGYCMGGRCAFVANATLPLRAAVSYYGGGIAPALLKRVPNLHGPQLFFWGEKDAKITPAIRASIIDAFRSVGKAFVNVDMSEAGHGFFCDQRAAYHADSAAEAWALTLAFLSRNLR